jgi:hypothetical protein
MVMDGGASAGTALPIAAAYYINLDARLDRREQMERELRKAGLAVVATRVAALTPQDSEVAAMASEFPGKGAGYHANAASHAHVWARVAKESTDGAALTLIMEDDIVLHKDWVALLRTALGDIHGHAGEVGHSSGGGGGSSSSMPSSTSGESPQEAPPTIDCVLLDGLFVTGEISAEFGWLGPPAEGTHRAECVAFSSAYALTPAAAQWLLDRRVERPGSSTEAYLMMLQEDRGASWTCLPRLALQRWDEAASSVAGAGGASNMRKWYEDNYFPRFPWSLYAQDAT